MISLLGRAAAAAASSRPILAALFTFGLGALGAGPAPAANMTFSGLTGDCVGTPSYTENGITATSGGGTDIAYHLNPGVLHMDDSGTTCPQSVEFTMARPFDAISVDILPLESNYCADPDNCSAPGDPYDNVLWEGFVGDAIVASSKFFMGTTDSTYVFGDAFRGLDKLKVSALLPSLAVIGGECFDAPCAHFELDNLNLAPIPLPATLWLLASGLTTLGAMGVWRRPRRRAAA